MDRAKFWQAIASAREAAGAGAGAGDVAASLVRRLERLPAREIKDFQGWLDAYRYAAHRLELWAAAAYIAGGCSDAAFDSFRGWLIAQGEPLYMRAMHDPSALADHRWPGDDARYPPLRCDAMLNPGHRAYEAVTGEPLGYENTLPTVRERASWPPDRIKTHDHTTDDVARLFPALAARWPLPR
jgi:hypothetical protein